LRRWLGALIDAKRRKVGNDPEMFATYYTLARESRITVMGHIATLIAQAAAIIADGMKRGEFQAADPAATARAVLDATGRFHNPAHAAEWADPQIDQAFEGVWQLVLRGLTAKP
jgi:pyridoxal biosynthesis lyase PdxS